MKTTHYNGPNAHRGSRLSNRKQSALRILMLQYFTHKQLNLPVSYDNTAKYTAEKKTHVNATRGRAQRGVKKDTKLQFHGRWQCSYTTTPFTQLGPLSSYGTEGDRTMEAPRDWKQTAETILSTARDGTPSSDTSSLRLRWKQSLHDCCDR